MSFHLSNIIKSKKQHENMNFSLGKNSYYKYGKSKKKNSRVLCYWSDNICYLFPYVCDGPMSKIYICSMPCYETLYILQICWINGRPFCPHVLNKKRLWVGAASDPWLLDVIWILVQCVLLLPCISNIFSSTLAQFKKMFEERNAQVPIVNNWTELTLFLQ